MMGCFQLLRCMKTRTEQGASFFNRWRDATCRLLRVLCVHIQSDLWGSATVAVYLCDAHDALSHFQVLLPVSFFPLSIPSLDRRLYVLGLCMFGKDEGRQLAQLDVIHTDGTKFKSITGKLPKSN
jgi:hypothetical protein